jgi:hypothetical protein
MKSAVLISVVVGGLKMELWESRGPRYSIVFSIVAQPDAISITYMGCDRALAWQVFSRKVECHRSLVGPP